MPPTMQPQLDGVAALPGQRERQFFGRIRIEFSIPANQTLHWRALSRDVNVSAVKGSSASPRAFPSGLFPSRKERRHSS
jgi:hypothetical protein